MINGRVPMVVGGAQLDALKRSASAAGCGLVDVLRAVFNLALKSVMALSMLGVGDLLSAALPDDFLEPTRQSTGYVVWLPLGHLREALAVPLRSGARPESAQVGGKPSATANFAADFFEAAQRLDPVAFVYARGEMGEAYEGAAGRRERYAMFTVVAEVTEFDRHILIECFFDPAVLDRRGLSRLMGHFAAGLHQVAALSVRSGPPPRSV